MMSDPTSDPMSDPMSDPTENVPKMRTDDKSVLVRMPDGSFVYRSRADVDAELAAEAAKESEPPAEEENYLALANGRTVRVKASEVPGPAGTNAPNGFFEFVNDNGKKEQVVVVAVYPAF